MSLKLSEKAVYLEKKNTYITLSHFILYWFHWLTLDKLVLRQTFHTCSFQMFLFLIPNFPELQTKMSTYTCFVYIMCILYYNSHFLNWLETYWLDKREEDGPVREFILSVHVFLCNFDLSPNLLLWISLQKRFFVGVFFFFFCNCEKTHVRKKYHK